MKQTYKNSLITLFWCVIVLGVTVVIMSAVDKKKDARTQSVNIQIESLEFGKYLINEEDIKEVIMDGFGSDLLGEQIKTIDVERLEVELEAEPFVLDAETYIDASQTININIKQRLPILRVLDSNGLDYYLDVHGVKMPPSKHYTARVLVATGALPPFTDDYLKREDHLINHLFDLTNFILDDPLLEPLVEQIHVKNKEFILVPKVGDHKILLGNMKNLEDKIKRLKIFYEEGMPRTGWQRYKELDLRYKGQVIGRR